MILKFECSERAASVLLLILSETSFIRLLAASELEILPRSAFFKRLTPSGDMSREAASVVWTEFGAGEVANFP